MRISTETEKRLRCLMRTIARRERTQEKLRLALSELPHFVPYAAFQYLDQQKRGRVGSEDLLQFLVYLLYSASLIVNTITRRRRTTVST